MSANNSLLLISYISLVIFGEKSISGMMGRGCSNAFSKTMKQLLGGDRGRVAGGGSRRDGRGWDAHFNVKSIHFNKIILTFIKKSS